LRRGLRREIRGRGSWRRRIMVRIRSRRVRIGGRRAGVGNWRAGVRSRRIGIGIGL
jgi:hypothetical protein